MPEISIITPVYADTPDKVRWLEEMLESVKAQTFTNWEVVLIDDSSPESLDNLKVKYPVPQFRWFRTPKQVGPSLARNTAAHLAESDGLLPVDADDRLLPHSLEEMYQAWKRNRSKIVYGDLQRLEVAGDQFQPGNVYGLPEYSFDNVLDPRGIIPVTALHSRDCHIAAGGWKAELDYGLEDVEYWIAAGKAGFCGQHVGAVTLLYRKHSGSRAWKLRRENKKEAEMQGRIKELHSDVYGGKYPMGCCGHSSGSSNKNSGGSSAASSASRNSPPPTGLDQYPALEKTWVQYTGRREASFGIMGQFTQISYQVNGPGHKLEVHRSDLPIFRRAGRGLDFTVGVAPPDDYIPVIEEVALPFRGPMPKLVDVFQLDEAQVIQV